MPALFDIEQSITDFILAAEESEGMTPEELKERDEFILSHLDELANQETEKVDNYGYLLKKIEADIQFLDDEESRIQRKRKSAEANYGRVKDRLKFIMEQHEIKKLTGKIHTISLRESKSVVVDGDPLSLPRNYLRHIPEKFEPDKKALGDALKVGIAIEGVRFEIKTSVQIR